MRGTLSLLHALQGVQQLILYNCRMGDVGATQHPLAPALRSSGLSGLQHLDLGNIVLSAAGAAALAPALQGLSKLQRLDISVNHLGAAGAAALATPLQSLSTLQRLDLSFNNMGAAGAAALATPLQSLST